MANPNLEFDPSTLNDRGDSYSSLTDLNGIEVFTLKFEDKVESVNQQLAEYEVFLAQQPFAGNMSYDASDEQIVSGLFLQNTFTSIKTEETNIQGATGLYVAVVALLFGIFLGALMTYCRKKTQRLEEEKRYINNQYKN